ncbi:MAG: tetratricopeptide repeat protein, partial [Terriglobales bacterium]
LQAALEQSGSTGLPFGRMLVLSGVISEAILMSALNAQNMLRERKIGKQQAIESLVAAKSRQKSEAVRQAERDFYALPKRGIRIGELLSLAGILSETQLANAVEIGLLNNKVLGTVLRDLNLVSEPVLQGALQLQEMISDQKINVPDAASVLALMHHSEMTFAAAMKQVRGESPRQEEITLTNFLKLVSRIQDSDIDHAVDVAKQNAQIVGKMLVLSGVLDEKTLNSANTCCLLIEQGALPLEQACIAFEYSQRKGISVNEALRELTWTRSVPNDTLTLPDQQNMREQVWTATVAEAAKSLKEGAPDTEERLNNLLSLVDSKPKHSLQKAQILEMMGALRSNQKRYAESEVNYRQALELRKSALGPTHDSVAAVVNHLARVCYHQKNYAGAEELCERFVRICKSKLGTEHPNIACGLNNLASIYHAQKKYNQAYDSYKESLRICERSLGQPHPTTIRLMRTFASLLREMKLDDEAKALDLRASGFFTGSWKTVMPIDQDQFDPEL